MPTGLSKIPGLQEQLTQGGAILELACGAGVGLVKKAHAYPNSTIVGVDGDAYSLELTAAHVRESGVGDRVSLVHSSLEDFSTSQRYDVAVNNISMHECRDIEKATANIHQALKPGGYFVISDFPFPESTEACRTIPARIMCGIQFFEALIDDQLLPSSTYVDLLTRHGFRNIGTVELSPVHALVHGQK